MASVLPIDTLVSIFTFLSPETIYETVSLVCKRWKLASESDLLWKRRCFTFYKMDTLPPSFQNWKSLYLAYSNSKYLVLSGTPHNPLEDVAEKLRKAGLKRTDFWNISKTGIPTIEYLQTFNSILVYSYTSDSFKSGETMGDLLIDYIFEGYGLVVCVFAECSNLGEGLLRGRFYPFHPFEPQTQKFSRSHQLLGDVREPNHPIMKNIENIRVKFDFNPGPVTPVAKPIAYFDDGNPLVAEVVNLPSTAGKIIGVNLFPLSTDVPSVGAVDTASDAFLLLAQALLYTNKLNKERYNYSSSKK